MSFLNELVTIVKTGILKFFNITTNANTDLPYHDFHHANSQTTDTSYTVGANQVNLRGLQKKLFVSKSTLIMSTENQTLHFNSINNVAITILAGVWYTFYSNIYRVYFIIPNTGKDLYLYFEGTLPAEARNPE